MPSEELLTGADWCTLSERWTVHHDVMRRAVAGANAFTAETGREVWIISGYRSPEKQRQLKEAGRPAAGVDVSNHTSCPATAVDVRIGFGPTNAMKAILGRVMVMQGLRWGGGSPVDPKTGIPADWNHFDAGTRVAVRQRGLLVHG